MAMDSNKFGAYAGWFGGFATLLGSLWTIYTYYNPKPSEKENKSEILSDSNQVKSLPKTNYKTAYENAKDNSEIKNGRINNVNTQKDYFTFSGIENTLEKEEIAVLILDGAEKINFDLELKIIDKLQRNNFGATAKFFKNQFISDGLFNRLLEGDRELIRRLNIASHADYIFLGKCSITIRENDQDTKTSIGKLSGVILNTQNGNIVKQISIKEIGEGFYEDDAEESVMIKITQQFPVNF